MAANPGLSAIIQQEIQSALSSPEGLPEGFWSYGAQYNAMNPVPVQATISPTIIASGVGSTSNSPTRYVGGTVTGAPSDGTYVAGDFVVSHDGHVYICTATGTPGTWSTWPAQGQISTASHNGVNVVSTNSVSPTTIVAGTSATYTGDPIFVELFADQVATPTLTNGFVDLQVLFDGAILSSVGTVSTPAAAQMVVPFYVTIGHTPSAGTHTYGLAAWTSSTTGTPYVGSLVKASVVTRFA